jgi:hypothetical protein
MDRGELAALRNAIDIVLTWPDSVRDQVAAWLAPTAQSGNGVDPHPPPVAAPAPPRQAKRRRPNAFTTQTIERRLIEALQGNVVLTERALANAASISRSSAGERLRTLAAHGVIEKGAGGRWRLKGEEKPRQPAAGEPADPPQAPPN